MRHTVFVTVFLTLQVLTGRAQLIGDKVGDIKGNTFLFATDTITLKEKLESIISKEGVKLDKIEIRKDTTFGDREEDYYMLIAYDFSKKLKTARWLANIDGGLYYRTIDPEGELTQDDMFFSTHFTCFGSDTDCFPMVVHLSEGYGWSGSEDLACKPDSGCTGIKTVIF